MTTLTLCPLRHAPEPKITGATIKDCLKPVQVVQLAMEILELSLGVSNPKSLTGFLSAQPYYCTFAALNFVQFLFIRFFVF